MEIGLLRHDIRCRLTTSKSTIWGLTYRGGYADQETPTNSVDHRKLFYPRDQNPILYFRNIDSEMIHGFRKLFPNYWG